MSSRPATVLVIDDEPEIVNLLTDVLKRDGYNVVGTTRAEQVPALIEAIPSLKMIVSDTAMPEMNGVDLIRRVCRSRPELKIVFTTAGTDDITCRRSDPVLAKPFDVAAFSSVVRRTLAERPSSRTWDGPERRRQWGL